MFTGEVARHSRDGGVFGGALQGRRGLSSHSPSTVPKTTQLPYFLAITAICDNINYIKNFKFYERKRIMSNIWHDISPKRIAAEDFIAVVEIPKGSKNKYELDKETGLILLDRILYTSTHYPANYGFIPRTYGDDLDPLDVLVLSSESIATLALVRCYPIGVISMLDDGKRDEKIIAIPFGDPTYNNYKDISELPAHIFDEMIHFFNVYKNLEAKETTASEVSGRETAIKIINEAIESYIKNFCR